MHNHKVCQEVIVDGKWLFFFLTYDSEMTPRTSPCPPSSCQTRCPSSTTCDPREEGRQQGEGSPPMRRSSMGSQGDTSRESPPLGGRGGGPSCQAKWRRPCSPFCGDSSPSSVGGSCRVWCITCLFSSSYH